MFYLETYKNKHENIENSEDQNIKFHHYTISQWKQQFSLHSYLTGKSRFKMPLRNLFSKNNGISLEDPSIFMEFFTLWLLYQQ